MKKKNNDKFILGLDVGANSVGWAILKADKDLNPTSLVNAGARVFEAGVIVDPKGGKEESRGKQRRDARLARRRLDRHARRLNYLFWLLQNNGLLPVYEDITPRGPDEKPRPYKSRKRHETLVRFEKELTKKWREKLRKEGKSEEDIYLLHLRLPYFLRARALDERMELHEIGRAIYHLAQRRGFRSNRKSQQKMGEKNQSEYLKDIENFSNQIKAQGCRTIGEFLSKRNPEDIRIRKEHTSRKDYLEEFEEIWKQQQKFYPDILTEELKNKIKEDRDENTGIFFQRGIKVRPELIGNCEFEKDEKRAPKALLISQKFRYLQKVNDARIKLQFAPPRRLTAEERQKMIEILESGFDLFDKKDGKITVTKIKKALGLKIKDKFNFETSDEEKLIGNRTAYALANDEGVFKDRWANFSDEDKDRIVEDLIGDLHDDELEIRAREIWGLDEQSAKKFSQIGLEDGYMNLSVKAMKNILPKMVDGKAYMEAVYEVYPPKPLEAMEILPPVLSIMPEVRNPVVIRVLSELRKVMNAIVKQYGKPTRIRIELARELKKPKSEREQIWWQNRKNEHERINAKQTIIENHNIGKPNRDDIEKYVLWEECGGVCPYCGNGIELTSLYSDHPQYDVDHIIPRSMILDDSFTNKVLCHSRENREKGNRTPFQMWGADEEHWNQIINRVRKLKKGRSANAKLKRFQLQGEELENFVSKFSENQLRDTAYATKLAKKYIGLLYGGMEYEWPIDATSGRLTEYIRDVFRLNGILGDGGRKQRTDHRHHAVDAVAIALTNKNVVDKLNYENAHQRKSRFKPVQYPWENFYQDAKAMIHQKITSHRINTKVNGPLHRDNDSIPPEEDANGKVKPLRKVSLPLEKLDRKTLEKIIDKGVREIIREKAESVDYDFLKMKDNYPFFTSKNNRKIPIRKARVWKNFESIKIGEENKIRYVVSEENHHVEILEVNGKWEGHVVSTFEASQRLLKKPVIVIKKDHGPDKKFLFSLAKNECVLMEDRNKETKIYVVKGISQYANGTVNLDFVLVDDARPIPKIPREGRTRTPDSLRESKARKILITSLGEIRYAND